ncbi:MAG: CsbD family protein [Herbaspirillum sp.]
MNWNVIEGDWTQYKSQVKAQWSKLSNDNLDIIAGKRDQLLGQIQKSYGIVQEEAEQEVAAFQKFLSESRRF